MTNLRDMLNDLAEELYGVVKEHDHKNDDWEDRKNELINGYLEEIKNRIIG